MRTDFAATPKTAIVIGAGVVGQCAALALQRSGFATTLIAPAGIFATASLGNAGHIAIEQVEPLASPAAVRGAWRRLFRNGGALALPPRDIATWLPFVIRLVWASRSARFAAGRAALSALLKHAMPAWRRVLDDAGVHDLLIEAGHIVVWESAATAAAGLARWRAAGTGTTRFTALSAAECAAVAASVAVPIAGGIRFTGSGQIADLPALQAALAARFAAIGGVRIDRSVAAIRAVKRRACVFLEDDSRMPADRIVVAAGAAAGELLTPLGLRVPMIAERGYHLHAGGDGLDLPPVVFEDRSVIITRFRNGMRMAGIVEFGRRDTPPDAAKWRRLQDHAAALGLPMEGATRWIGARPTLPDYLPAIGRAAVADNLLYAFGHQHLGLTLAAVTGELVAALARGAEPRVDLAPFDLTRFERRASRP
ncbi:NAD(P)/FAD-dependent oxidoreductase [Sphingomonas prati]|uniref:D-amino-acid dehydrogenase n=1 Tax=Sphingomonas prati TaxID=1843237 RepID=A0A7W9F1H9_9SPHN|nr:FAD-binding oxidoreductase [Sphingomonas prati]MBB5729333.1 D-amino-acid dehydrogenase [Sphingomonas prati]GGE78285.1 D-amino-acid dehydrogenase [Sphingomonas prati]